MKNKKTHENVETLSEEVRAFYSWNPERKKFYKQNESCLNPNDGLLDWKVINSWMRFDGKVSCFVPTMKLNFK